MDLLIHTFQNHWLQYLFCVLLISGIYCTYGAEANYTRKQIIYGLIVLILIFLIPLLLQQHQEDTQNQVWHQFKAKHNCQVKGIKTIPAGGLFGSVSEVTVYACNDGIEIEATGTPLVDDFNTSWQRK